MLQANYNEINEEIRKDPQNAVYTRGKIRPLYYANPKAKILIIGQAPGRKAQDTHIIWNDVSGVRLRQWLGVSDEVFYHSGKIAVLPMDFYFPGKGKSGDLPPRKGFAAKWHPLLLKTMPEIQLTVLVGSYAVKHYLNLKSSAKLTDVVRAYQSYLPEYFPIVHPSPRNQIWMARNSWFATQVIPALRSKTENLLKN
ncbi:uracil-DNA glycosylase family protein [Liquorilactobacillus uvarum]|uniref:Uracil DNA glycosylase n=1 Tax=Liquorilactobacillus uvarum DSM 19971 TaxID=1423812 RepID=A0A0R1PXZ7_9LACO|nr:uracil-DNA glycosylase family protein [Liquorilactobacillus uvarum]KRL37391.1 uracil DNA glycosylase [Liquorilactobacillus uvarum DSM 19971]